MSGRSFLRWLRISRRSRPSRTSQAVALARSGMPRPTSPEGDPGAQESLCRGMRPTSASWFRPQIRARTRFFDDQVMGAISAGTSQVVVCGAGYDDRGLRFRTTGVRFFELDHPATQVDKARRLRAIEPAGTGLALAPTDFRVDDVASALIGCGHDAGRPSLFICEGLLVYLDQPTCSRLLGGLRSRAAPGSTLAVSLAVHRTQSRPRRTPAGHPVAASPGGRSCPSMPISHCSNRRAGGWSGPSTPPSSTTELSPVVRSSFPPSAALAARGHRRCIGGSAGFDSQDLARPQRFRRRAGRPMTTVR